MNSSENIGNAFKVVYKTYENVDKMMKYCKSVAEDNNYTVLTDKFLRWRSDNDVYGWAISNFILLFQNKDDLKLENGWRRGPIYTVEIDFTAEKYPVVYVAKYEYRDINAWNGQISTADSWRFYWPVRTTDYFGIEAKGDYNIHTLIVGNEATTEKSYRGLKRVVRCSKQLVNINAENLEKEIFREFDLIENI